ncbi:Os04g0541234, partial [Oryza sativa Japonica Group]
MRWRKEMMAASREAAAARSWASCSCSRLRRATSCLRHASSRAVRSASRFSIVSRNRRCISSCLSTTCLMSPSKKVASLLPPAPRLRLPRRSWLPPVSAVISSSSDSSSDSDPDMDEKLKPCRLMGGCGGSSRGTAGAAEDIGA